MTHLRTLRLLVLAGLLAGGAGVARAEDPPPPEEPAAPETPAPEAPAPETPAPAPEAAPPADAPIDTKALGGMRRWMLGLSHGPLRHVRDGGATYHYVLLTVENKTETTRTWKPHVRAVVDGTKTHVACGCSGAVEQVRRRERDSSLLSVEASAGPLAPGQSKRIAAVFGPIDSGWNRLTLLVGGLVNPLVVHRVQKYGDAKLKVGDAELDPVIIADAAYEQRNTAVLDAVRKAAKESGGEVPAPTVEYREFMENRAYAIDWQREGDEFRPELDTIDFVREGWKVIGEPVVFRTVTPRFVSGS